MGPRFRMLLSVVVVLVATGLLVPASVAGQSADDGWTLPRTPDGHPDLGGVWANNSATPLERPEAWADKERLTDEELAALLVASNAAVGDGDALFGDQLVLAAIAGIEATSYDPTTGNYNQFWIAERDFDNRTSLVIDPPDGRIPGLTPEAQERRGHGVARRDEHPADTYTDRPLQERCVSYGVPRLGAGYNSYYQVFQSADHVVFLNEMIHDARVIPIDGQPHLADRVRQLHGDSRGHWDGDTLVIETTNYSSQARFRGASDNLHMVERLTRVGPRTLDYEVTITDPTTWTRPWTVMIPLMGSDDAIFEYACHEGNIGMEGILAGHRAEERETTAESGSK
ncbi:MAG: hypothetical protein VX975_03050 [Acidobacteriota bacterium]|nr:hypothetical protein [Acidobacteriota bacterium]